LATVLPALLKPQGRFMFAMNGIPWWIDRVGGIRLPEALRIRLDPGGALASRIDPANIVGAVVQSSNEVIAPGIVRNVGGGRNAMVIGRPGGGPDASLDALAAMLLSAGYAARISADIRAEIWSKTLLAASAGPVAALTGVDLGKLTADPDAFALLAGLMREGVAIGRAFGLGIEEDVEARLAFFRGKPIRPSMLQDAEAGRELEVQNSILALARIATALGVDAPRTQVVSALMAMLAVRTHLGSDAGSAPS
jgi:2-dehydropantoate 2-reductase